METYVRKSENWLKSFAEWTLPRSEANESVIFWTGVYTIAACLRRRVKVGKNYLGSWSCYPNMYILFVAKAGMRKTTTVDYADDLLGFIKLDAAPDIITRESLLSKITKSPDNSMYILAGEFGEFMVKSGKEMYSFLTNAYDGRKRGLGASTIGRGDEMAAKPCVNMIGATTPEWIADEMPPAVLGGGFASRVLFVHIKSLRRREIFYHDQIDMEDMDAKKKELLLDLAHIANNIVGDFTITEEGVTFFRDWYRNQAGRKSAASYKLDGYFERKPAHVLKLAMILKIAKSDELILDKLELQNAIDIVEQNEKHLPKVFEDIGKNPYSADIHIILRYIQEEGKVTKKQVFEHFMHVATPKLLDEFLDGLYIAGMIKLVTTDGVNYLIPA